LRVGVSELLKQNWKLVSRLERIGDSLVVIAVFFLAYHSRDFIFNYFNTVTSATAPKLKPLGAIDQYFIILGAALPAYTAALSLLGAYRSMRLSTAFSLLRTTVFASAFVFLGLGFILYILKLDLSRSFVALYCGMSALCLFLERWVVLLALRYFRGRGRNFRNLLVVGTGEQAKKMYREVSANSDLGIRVVGFVSFESGVMQMAPIAMKAGAGANTSSVIPLQPRVVASVESFETALKKFAVDEVLFTDVLRNYQVIDELAQIAVEEGVRVTLAADLFSLEIFKSDISYFGSYPLIHYQPSPGDSSALALKRFIDVTAATVLLVGLAPIMLGVAVAIKLDSKGKVFFSQRRVGLNGRTFTLYKFRSMVADAEALRPMLMQKNEMQGPVFKISKDPRITKVGQFIRRYSLDELPQLWNVIRGDMSLVGPRPPLPEEVKLYGRKQRRRLSMRPGLTCTWQVSGRNDIPSFEQWAELDLQYIDSWSLTSDLKLLLKTIPVVFSGTGAR